MDLSGTLGAATINPDGTVEYDTNAQFDWLSAGETATDHFNYTLSDGNGGVDTSTTTITITGENDAPTAILLDTATVDENAAGAIFGNLTTLDVDAADNHTYTIDDDRFEISNGQLKLKDDISLNHEAADRINVTLIATDSGGLQVSQTFELTVNDVNEAPTASDINRAINEDTPLTISAADLLTEALAMDVDNGDLLSVISVQDALGGAALLSGGLITFTPSENYHGPASFSFTLSDGNGATITKTVNLSIAALNDTPTSSTPIANQTALEDSAFTFAIPANAFEDADGDTLRYTATLSNGLALPSWLSFNAETRVFSGTPEDDDIGEVSLRITATDGDNESASQIFTVNVRDSATHRGTDSDDVITGTAESDRIVGEDGSDRISGGEGDDLIDTGAGNDHFDGNNGNDTIYAGEGDDVGNAGAGDDIIYLGSGNDMATGSFGNDIIYGEDGDDLLFGDPGNDSLYGGNGSDRLIGMQGDDSLFGQDGADYLYGGAGNDVFVYEAFSDSTFDHFDTIKDFTSGEDHIDLTHLADEGLEGFSDITIEYADGKAIITHGEQFMLELLNTEDGTLTQSDFIFA